MFILYAKKNELNVRQREMVTSGSVKVYRAKFLFSPDWEGMTRKAIFIGSGEQKPVLLDDSGECDIPWETVTKHGGHLYAGVFGTTDDSTLPTIKADLGKILEGVTDGGEPSRPPTPSLLEQELDKKQDKINGLPGQVAGFDEDGKLVPVDMPSVGNSGLPTLAGVLVDNISFFSNIRLPCCIHCVNVGLGYTFQDDIIYVSRGNDILTVITMDNVTATFSIDPDTGALNFLRSQRLERRLEEIEEDIQRLLETGGSGGGSGTTDHRLLTNRNAEDQHPIDAISGLREAVAAIPRPMTADELRKILNGG